MRHRILFYSHDSFGLGHFRRSLTIAGYLARHIEGLSVLMLTGLDSAASFEAPAGVDFVKLPGIRKSGPDEYQSRHLRVSFARVQRIREQLIHGVARAFNPSLFVVDNVPRGIDGELLQTLRYFRRRRPQTRIALTLRDLLDTPENIVPLWKELGIYSILGEYYDEIWIAGCKALFDPISLYEFPDPVAQAVKYCGYVVRSHPRQDTDQLAREFRLGDGRFVLVSCGGGGDGYPLIDAYTEVARRLGAEGIRSVVFLGPDMAIAERRALKERLLPMNDYVLTFDYRPDLVGFLEIASVSVSMGGYNTVAEVISRAKPAVIIPRTHPRLEQLLRVQKLSEYGLLEIVTPEELGPDALEGAIRGRLAQAQQGGPPALPDSIDFAGLRRITRRVAKHLGVEEKG